MATEFAHWTTHTDRQPGIGFFGGGDGSDTNYHIDNAISVPAMRRVERIVLELGFAVRTHDVDYMLDTNQPLIWELGITHTAALDPGTEILNMQRGSSSAAVAAAPTFGTAAPTPGDLHWQTWSSYTGRITPVNRSASLGSTSLDHGVQTVTFNFDLWGLRDGSPAFPVAGTYVSYAWAFRVLDYIGAGG